MGCIHYTPHLAHVILLSVISSSHKSVKLSTLIIYQYIHTCATSFRDVGLSSHHLDHAQIDFSISSFADSVVSPHSPRTTVMSVISVFSHLVSVFARFRLGLVLIFPVQFKGLFQTQIVSTQYLVNNFFVLNSLISFISVIEYRYSPSIEFKFMIQLPQQFIFFSMLMHMPTGLAWNHLWSWIPCPRLGGSSGHDRFHAHQAV